MSISRTIDNPVMLDVPEEVETERLLIRCPQFGDGAAVNEALRESWNGLQRWMLWAVGSPPSIAETEAHQRGNRATYETRNAFHFNAYLKETGEFVCKPALFHVDWEVPKCEIGYWIRTRFEGRGLMTEAVVALTAFAFEALGMARVELRCDPRNTRSVAVARRAGFTLEGCLHREARDPQGSLRDTLLYAHISGSSNDGDGGQQR